MVFLGYCLGVIEAIERFASLSTLILKETQRMSLVLYQNQSAEKCCKKYNLENICECKIQI